jgi:hypothetical protein
MGSPVAAVLGLVLCLCAPTVAIRVPVSYEDTRKCNSGLLDLFSIIFPKHPDGLVLSSESFTHLQSVFLGLTALTIMRILFGRVQLLKLSIYMERKD